MGHNSVNIVQWSYSSFLCTSSVHGLHLHQVSQKYLEQFESDGADTISLLIITKEHNSINIAYGVTVLVLCKPPNHGLHLYQVSPKYLEGFKSYGADTILILIIT